MAQNKIGSGQAVGGPLLGINFGVISEQMPPEIKPREMTPEEESRLLPEIISVTNATLSCASMSSAEFEPYLGQFVAWGPDGKTIIAQSKERERLVRELDTLGLDARLCVIQFIDDAQDRI